MHDFDPCDGFDQHTLHLELRHANPHRRGLARTVLQLLHRLVRARSADEGVPLAVSWASVFDRKRLLRDLTGPSRERAGLASAIVDTLAELERRRTAKDRDAVNEEDERFARIMRVWLDWLRRKVRESSAVDANGGAHG